MNVIIAMAGFTFFANILFSNAYKSYLDNKGYEKINNKISIGEGILDLIEVTIFCAIPVFNIMICYLIIFCRKKLFEEFFVMDLETKKIQPKSEYIDLTKQQDLNIKIDIKEKQQDVTKNYSDMTNEEKIKLLCDLKKQYENEENELENDKVKKL